MSGVAATLVLLEGVRSAEPVTSSGTAFARTSSVRSDAPMDIASGIGRRPDVRRRRDLGIVGRGEIGRAGDEFGNGFRQNFEREIGRPNGYSVRNRTKARCPASPRPWYCWKG